MGFREWFRSKPAPQAARPTPRSGRPPVAGLAPTAADVKPPPLPDDEMVQAHYRLHLHNFPDLTATKFLDILETRARLARERQAELQRNIATFRGDPPVKP